MREQEGRIGYQEGLALGFAILSAKALLQYPGFLVEIGATAAWQVALISMLGALAAFWPAARLMQRFPGVGLGAMAEEAAGWPGALLALGAAGYLGVLGALLTRNVAESYIVAILPETPPSVLILGLVVCALTASYKGIEPLGRTALIFLPFGLLLTVGLVLLNWNHLHWPWVYPLLGYGGQETVAMGLVQIGSFAEILALVACGYAFRSANLAAKAGRHAIILAGLAIAVLTLAFLIIFGYKAAADMPFPAFIMAQNIYLGRFFQRMESAFVFIGFFSGAVTLSLLFHAVIAIITDVLHLPYHRPLLYPVAIIWFTGAIMPKDFRVVMEALGWMRSWGGLIMLGLPLLLLLLATVRGKGRSESHVA